MTVTETLEAKLGNAVKDLSSFIRVWDGQEGGKVTEDIGWAQARIGNAGRRRRKRGGSVGQ